MKTLAQCLAETAYNYRPRFLTFMSFVMAAECEFDHGFQDDYDHVRTENVPGDNGGRTKYGIDQASHPRIDIANLTMNDAVGLYLTEDWIPGNCDAYPAGYGEFLCDVRLNGGHGPQMVQQGLNTLGAGLLVDGWLGSHSVAAMLHYGDAGVTASLARRDAFYQYLADNHPNDMQFLNGWENRDAALAAWLKRNQALAAHLAITLVQTSAMI